MESPKGSGSKSTEGVIDEYRGVISGFAESPNKFAYGLFPENVKKNTDTLNNIKSNYKALKEFFNGRLQNLGEESIQIRDFFTLAAFIQEDLIECESLRIKGMSEFMETGKGFDHITANEFANRAYKNRAILNKKGGELLSFINSKFSPAMRDEMNSAIVNKTIFGSYNSFIDHEGNIDLERLNFSLGHKGSISWRYMENARIDFIILMYAIIAARL